MFEVGDFVQASDNRTGIVVEVKTTHAKVQRIVVRFTNGTLWDGSADCFRLISD